MRTTRRVVDRVEPPVEEEKPRLRLPGAEESTWTEEEVKHVLALEEKVRLMKLAEKEKRAKAAAYKKLNRKQKLALLKEKEAKAGAHIHAKAIKMFRGSYNEYAPLVQRNGPKISETSKKEKSLKTSFYVAKEPAEVSEKEAKPTKKKQTPKHKRSRIAEGVARSNRAFNRPYLSPINTNPPRPNSQDSSKEQVKGDDTS